MAVATLNAKHKNLDNTFCDMDNKAALKQIVQIGVRLLQFFDFVCGYQCR